MGNSPPERKKWKPNWTNSSVRPWIHFVHIFFLSSSTFFFLSSFLLPHFSFFLVSTLFFLSSSTIFFLIIFSYNLHSFCPSQIWFHFFYYFPFFPLSSSILKSRPFFSIYFYISSVSFLGIHVSFPSFTHSPFSQSASSLSSFFHFFLSLSSVLSNVWFFKYFKIQIEILWLQRPCCLIWF